MRPRLTGAILARAVAVLFLAAGVAWLGLAGHVGWPGPPVLMLIGAGVGYASVRRDP